MRVLFAGSPEIAVPSLQAVASEFQLVGILTNPDAPCGRGRCLAQTDIADAAAASFPDIPLIKAGRLGPAERAAVAELKPDVMAVFAYGTIFGPKFLSLFPKGSVNVHPSLLPRWRGCAPLSYAILKQDRLTGVTVQRLALALDSGDILARQELVLNGRETTGSLSEWAARVGAQLLVKALKDLEAGNARPVPQDESQASYCATLTKDDGRLDWLQSALQLDAQIRAFDPWPGTWTLWQGERLGILAAQPYPEEAADAGAQPGTVLRVDTSKGIMVKTGMGILALTRLQARGKKPLPFRDFINGVRGLAGSCFGS